MRIDHAELARDVVAHFGGRRRREREDRRTAEPLDHGAEREIVGTEVVAPLAHAVRFVDDEQAHGAREQPLEEVTILESLGREIENLSAAFADTLGELARLDVGEMRVHRERVDAVRRELVLLVLHQRDQRAHDDSEAGKHQRRQLIDERLAAARRHDDERVAPSRTARIGSHWPFWKSSWPNRSTSTRRA